MKTKNIITAIIALFIITSVSYGQSFNTAKCDSLLDLLAVKNKAMGSMAIAENGKIIYTKAIGYLQLEPRIASNEKTKYRIGSISKMFTATLIFQLIEEGKLDLATTLDKFFPTVPNAEKITMGNLLAHRSGIHSFTNDSAYLIWMVESKTREEMVKIISEPKSEFEPGTKTEYSNSNFVLLGYIAEIAGNAPYQELLQQRICSKAGLEDTYYGCKTDVNKNESFSYQFVTQWEKQPETNMSIPHGAGALVSTPSDLIKFIQSLFAGQLIREESLNQMKTITDGLGMGMQQFPYEDKTIYGHGGSIDGFNSLLCYFPNEKLALAYCSNGTAYSINDILLGALSIYYNKPYALPVFTSFAVKPEDLDKYPGTYSSIQIPLKITISQKDGRLFGQATGQPSFPLEPTALHTFKFEMAGVVIKFNPENEEFVLEQGGGIFKFTKDK